MIEVLGIFLDAGRGFFSMFLESYFLAPGQKLIRKEGGSLASKFSLFSFTE